MTLIDAITGKKSWGEAWGDVKDIVLERKDSIVDTVGGLYDKGKAGVKQTQNAINITVNSKSDAKAEDIAKLTADEVEQAAAELGGD
jgi:capsular polysaccharide biosynthesis protein